MCVHISLFFLLKLVAQYCLKFECKQFIYALTSEIISGPDFQTWLLGEHMED